VLERVGFDRAVERGGVKKALESSQYDASDVVSKIIFYGLFLLVLQMAFGVFGPNPVSDLLRDVIAYIPKVIVAIIIVVIASAIAGYLADLGVSHLYSSPYLQAAKGSAHGYDVIDPTRVNEELGGEEGHALVVCETCGQAMEPEVFAKLALEVLPSTGGRVTFVNHPADQVLRDGQMPENQ